MIVPTPGGDALKEKWQAAVHAYADGKGTVGALMKAGADLLTRIEALEASNAELWRIVNAVKATDSQHG